MAKKLKDILSKARNVAGAPGRAIAGAYYDSKTRIHKKNTDQLVDDIKTVRSMNKSGVERGSMQDPMSRGRREMRIDDFKRSQALTGLPKGTRIINAEDDVPDGKYNVERKNGFLMAIPKKKRLFNGSK